MLDDKDWTTEALIELHANRRTIRFSRLYSRVGADKMGNLGFPFFADNCGKLVPTIYMANIELYRVEGQILTVSVPSQGKTGDIGTRRYAQSIPTLSLLG